MEWERDFIVKWIRGTDPKQVLSRAPGYLAGSTVAEGTRRAVTQVARVPFFAITDPV